MKHYEYDELKGIYAEFQECYNQRNMQFQSEVINPDLEYDRFNAGMTNAFFHVLQKLGEYLDHVEMNGGVEDGKT